MVHIRLIVGGGVKVVSVMPWLLTYIIGVMSITSNLRLKNNEKLPPICSYTLLPPA